MRRIQSFIMLLLILMSLSCQKADQKTDEIRYVVLSPEIAEILAALGLEDRIVGLTDECTYPPSLQEIPRVGAFGAIKTENVIALKPSLIFSSGLEQEGISKDLERLGYQVVSVYPKSVAEIYESIMRVGAITGTDKEAESLVQSMQSEIDALRQSNAGKSIPKVYLEIYRDPIMSVADNSFVGELIEIAGGNNVFDTLERDYSRVKAEDVIAAKPDIMICYSQDSLQNIRSRKGWQDIPAIRDSMIFFEDSIDPDLIQRAGPRIVEGLRKLSQIYDIYRESTR
ncbi:MAG: cobalamin-binding protein [Candidatus Cloacimonetes bacterium]|nr:cobalamin-binding protein [Candidatus Cloacimonadota bacterium]MDD4099607.1 cobalamin-binding protein [Candidatus Cloacimonadota bacterium]MDD4805737.1 cobalamin-binding protein [Candidatus Cloacimonadota bacterium]